jgi:hypothetical protein
VKSCGWLIVGQFFSSVQWSKSIFLFVRKNTRRKEGRNDVATCVFFPVSPTIAVPACDVGSLLNGQLVKTHVA